MTHKPVICLSDLHGAFYTLTRLLNKAPKGSKVVFGGDLIDRGPHSRQVVEFAMEHGIPTCGGNHEDLCIAFYSAEGYKAHCGGMYDSGVWLDNGGDKAAANWPTIDKRSIHWRRDEYAGGRVPNGVLDWMAALPAYLFPSEELDEKGRKLCVSHTGYLLGTEGVDWFKALWGRHSLGDGEFPDDGYHRVLGHTQAKEVQTGEGWTMIDTGAAYANRGYGVLSALLWPSKVVLTQPFDESPVKPTFTIANGCIVG